MFSKACEYGIRATLYIATHSLQGQRVSLRDIAGKIDSPEAFTSKILQQLVHHDIVSSVKGAGGGFEIKHHKMQGLTLGHIVSAIDGEDIFNGCVLGLSTCSESHPCPAHSRFASIRSELKNMLEKTDVLQLAQSLDDGHTFLKPLAM